MLLIITDSTDVTSDCIIQEFHKFGYKDFLRFNTDLYESYDIEVMPNGFNITDPTGRTVNKETLSALYWRKPWMTIEPEPYTLENFEYQQRKYLVRDIVNLCIHSNNVYHLVEPYAEHRVGKIIQMIVAEKYFPIPEWKIISGNKVKTLSPPWLVKTLYNMRVGMNSPKVSAWTSDTLSPSYQWFLQKEVKGNYDVTVVYVNGQIFAYRLKREHLDWRTDINESMEWTKFSLTSDVAKNIDNYMIELNLKYGRLDFIQDCQGVLHFLEVNPNGQFAWLDLNNTDGLIKCVAQNAIGAPYA